MALMDEISQQIGLTKASADEAFMNRDFGQAKAKYLEAIEMVEDEGFLEEFKLHNPERVRECVDEFRKEALKKVAKCNRELSPVHFQYGRNLYREREYKKAIDEFETAMELAPEEEGDYITSIRKCIDRAKYRLTSALLLKNAAPLALQGDDYFEIGEFALAATEYEKALEIYKNARQYEHDRTYLNNKLQLSRRHLLRPYLRQSYEAREFGHIEECIQNLKKALLLVDKNDSVIRKFLRFLISEIEVSKIKKPLPEIKNPREWEEKITAFEDLRDKFYANVSTSSWLPLDSGAFISNEYTEDLKTAQIELAALYEKRAEELNEQGFNIEAIENLDEALTLLEEVDLEHFKEVNQKKLNLEKLSSRQKPVKDVTPSETKKPIKTRKTEPTPKKATGTVKTVSKPKTKEVKKAVKKKPGKMEKTADKSKSTSAKKKPKPGNK
ncbi:tetratricopeptide repeat protein [Candidatus Riflebacteria bacterium]